MAYFDYFVENFRRVGKNSRKMGKQVGKVTGKINKGIIPGVFLVGLIVNIFV